MVGGMPNDRMEHGVVAGQGLQLRGARQIRHRVALVAAKPRLGWSVTQATAAGPPVATFPAVHPSKKKEIRTYLFRIE